MKSKNAYAKMIAKAWSDPQFKERLLKHPEAVLKEYEIDIPKDMKIYAHENTEKTIHIVIPLKPAEELSIEDLERKVVGGTTTNCSQSCSITHGGLCG